MSKLYQNISDNKFEKLRNFFLLFYLGPDMT